ncbi:hypothetical protein Gbro_1429 [Gordonia bronchialis DSM 43247]|uniref:Uncharacterized protein n=1 Tax=Gordonia bronchialis (strain ATCC 25592 / DSM 43247 / BCRC 13721 / JCM 3198 / KCTC 3076 / NBRC 16047 / NCTC 10667) TaxID=526226 RepID=D0L6F4_GORB4|nr:hypothetical protein [Gordonia bronchialis]ACY20711.1 hypothetical protein Gbro_1429 [Gordonia bronchialis DSM 43247]MCC3323484.1 hypothetical protein [Gordonia bronchialis]QGS25537.1 hypothetical protein FOB84_16730 [Gordonia bronchialis]STQ63540.1 Uncharacterised protein [Gordonia bronchialis]
MSDDLDPYMGYQEIHRDLVPGIPIGTLRALECRGDLPPSIVVGRRRLWRRSAIVGWLAGLEAQAEAAQAEGVA